MKKEQNKKKLKKHKQQKSITEKKNFLQNTTIRSKKHNKTKRMGIYLSPLFLILHNTSSYLL